LKYKNDRKANTTLAERKTATGPKTPLPNYQRIKICQWD